MSDANASYKWDRTERPASKSGDSASAKKQTSLRKTAGWTPGLSRADVLRLAHRESGESAHLRGVLGRRQTITTDRNEH